MAFDGVAFGKEIVAAVKQHVDRSLAPVLDRLKALEEVLAAPMVFVPDLDAVKADMEALRKSVSEIPPPPEFPHIPTKDEILGWIPQPELPDFKAMLDEAVAALPPPEKGEKGDKGDPGEPGRDGVDGAPGRDGLDVVKFLRGESGHLIGVLRDGTTTDLGEYVGKDGEPGRDGFGFDDLKFEHDGEREFKLRFIKGDAVKEFPFRVPVMIYRGVYREGEQYEQGDVCTWGGSLWHCDTQTKDKPGGEQKCWTLAAKKGRDGKDAPVTPKAA
jgi:hypothetical protein